MKKILPYLVVFIISTVATVLIAVGLIALSPERFFPSSEQSAQHAAGTDTTRTGHSTAGGYDSVSVANAEVPPPLSGVPATRVAEPAVDSILTPPEDAAFGEQVSPAPTEDTLRTQRRKSMAKVLEEMKPDQAAKILRNIPDEELRELMLILKKRQAAKILGSLDPERVARILR